MDRVAVLSVGDCWINVFLRLILRMCVGSSGCMLERVLLQLLEVSARIHELDGLNHAETIKGVPPSCLRTTDREGCHAKRG